MVVSDNINSDVVFLIEATAHISPYVESLKTNYIIPTLEYFGGTSPESDFGTDNNINSTLYGIVAFMSMDCKPDSASVCYAPTSNSSKFLQWLDKIQFIGGAGDSSSHIVEGLSTAINLLDDFKTLREKSRSNNPQNIKSQKYCILICNSTPYLEPSTENPVFCGYTIEQLMSVIGDRNINFSIFSPRKMAFLYKLFESAGGNLSNALQKNYAKDRRHLVLLNGFHLQEKPMSPNSQSSSTEQDKALIQHQGIKRPISPNSNPNSMLSSQQIISRNQQMNTMMGNDAQFAQHSKLSADNIILQVRVGSPSVNHWPGNGNVPSPSQGPRIPAHPPVRARASTPQNINPTPSPSQMPNLIPQISTTSKPSPVNSNTNPHRPPNPNLNQIRPQQQIQSPFSTPQAPSPSQPQPSPHGLRAVPSPIQNSAPSPISQPQQFIQQQMGQINQQHINQIPQSSNINQIGNMPPNVIAPNINPSMQPMMINNQRTRIWNGVIEYQDKTQPQPINSPQNKISYLLDCQITYQHNNNEPEFTAERWPEKLLINTVPKILMNRLSPIFKNDSYHVNFIFTSDSPGLQKLMKAMSANSVGCIQLPNPANIRIIIVFYMPDKKLFVGFIPHNQDEFMTSMKELIESHKKEQQVKQKMLNQMAIGHQPPQSQIVQAQSPVSSSQVSNPQPQMSGIMPIQMSHGQMGQVAHLNTSHSSPNTMFQLQQMSPMTSNANLQPNSNASIAKTLTQSGPVSMPQSTNTTAGSNILLNQALGSIPNSNLAKNSFIPNNPNIQATTSSTGIQIINAPQASAINQIPAANSQANVGPQMIQSNAAPQPPASAQQFGMMQNSAQHNNANAANNANAPAGRGFGQNEREQNLIAIKQLEQTLKEAQRKEMEYQQLQTPEPGQTASASQMISQNPTALQQQQQNSAVVRQHLQQQLQQKQMIHLQQQQQQQQHQANNNLQQQHQVNSINNNLQLRHLLQQQQMRAINPGRIHPQQQQQIPVPVSQQQQQQSQILLQPNSQLSQQQQYRFQTPIQAQQQQQQQTPVQGQQQQPHGRNFYDSNLF